MQKEAISKELPRTREELHTEIASLIAEGFLSFHPTSPMFFSIENAIVMWHQQPESTLVQQLLDNCGDHNSKLAEGLA